MRPFEDLFLEFNIAMGNLPFLMRKLTSFFMAMASSCELLVITISGMGSSNFSKHTTGPWEFQDTSGGTLAPYLRPYFVGISPLDRRYLQSIGSSWQSLSTIDKPYPLIYHDIKMFINHRFHADHPIFPHQNRGSFGPQVLYFAAMGPPGGGRNFISPRVAWQNHVKTMGKWWFNGGFM